MKKSKSLIVNNFNFTDLDFDENLKEEIENLTYEVKEIPIDLIDNPPFHDRSFYSKEKIVELAENIKIYGLAHPIVVRKKENGRYERIIGFRRIKAFEYLGRDKIPAVVLLDVSKDTALALMLSENIQRENLNDYDKVYSQVQYLQFVFKKESLEDTIKFILRVNNYKLGNVRNLSEEEKEEAIKLENLIKAITGKSLRTFIDKLKLLNIHPLIKDAVRRNNWSYTIALELNKLAKKKKIKELETLIKEAEQNHYGYAFIKKRVSEILNENGKVSFSSISRRLSSVYNRLSDEDKELVNNKLKEIENIISKYLKKEL